MLNRRKIKSMELIEVLLIFLAIILLVGILFFIGKELKINTVIYNVLVASLIFIATLIVSIVVFQFVKRKYIEALKDEIEEDFDVSRSKLEEKVLNINNRIFGFETNYSKKLKKIMKDYNIKVKEIENIKKELSIKLTEEDMKIACLEIEICKIKLANNEDYDEKERESIRDRIVRINELYPSISDEKILNEVKEIKNAH